MKQLWVDEAIRGNGVDKQLMSLLVDGAKSRGCNWVWLDTFDFQALPFYEKPGFDVFAELYDFPQGHKRIFLKKNIGDIENEV